MVTQDSPSLYERLGGVYSIATVIDDFIDRIMVDPRLNANPKVFPPQASNISLRRWCAGLLAGPKSIRVVP
jgi:truncated hemoglobin YjbI